MGLPESDDALGGFGLQSNSKQQGDLFTSRSVLAQRLFSKFAQNGMFAEQILNKDCSLLNKASGKGRIPRQLKTKKAVSNETAFL